MPVPAFDPQLVGQMLTYRIVLLPTTACAAVYLVPARRPTCRALAVGIQQVPRRVIRKRRGG